MKRTRSTSQRRDRRSGVAAVEVAVLLPIFLLLTFCAIEASNATYLKRDVTLAAYIAATELEDRRGTVQLARDEAIVVLQSRSITNYTVAITDSAGNTLASVNPGQQFTVTVTAPFAGNSMSITQIFAAMSVSGTATMVRSI